MKVTLAILLLKQASFGGRNNNYMSVLCVILLLRRKRRLPLKHILLKIILNDCKIPARIDTMDPYEEIIISNPYSCLFDERMVQVNYKYMKSVDRLMKEECDCV